MDRQRAFKDFVSEELDQYRFASNFVEGKRVLDIACNTGFGTAMLLEMGQAREVYGVDINPSTIEFCKQNHQGTFVVGDGTALKFDDGFFDVVVSLSTIEHIAEYRKFIAELRRVLKQDGILVMSAKNERHSAKKPSYKTSFSKSRFAELMIANFQDLTFYGQTAWYIKNPAERATDQILHGVDSSSIKPLANMSYPPHNFLAVGYKR